MEPIQFDYFRGLEAEQYNFYRVPKILFTGECFRALSCEAKVLYGLMLDRMNLSIKNQWIDEENRPYIFFTIEEIMEFLDCKTQKATKLMKELDTESGIGLIEKKRLGMGKPNVIYVKNFMVKSNVEPKSKEKEPETPENTQTFENQNSRISEIKNQDFRESKIKTFENQNTGLLKIKNQDFRESKIKTFENQSSRNLKIENQEFRKSKCNNTDNNKTDYSETNPIHLSADSAQQKTEVRDLMDEVQIYTDIVKSNIEYDTVWINTPEKDRKYVDEMVELMVEMLCIKKDPILIAGAEYPCQLVKSKLLKIDSSHIEYILWSLKKNTTKIRNIKAYLLTCIFNAPSTIHNFYHAEVNHDLCGAGV